MNMKRDLRLIEWHSIQQSIADCQKCCQHWPSEITQPLKPGEIPDPPEKINVLFIGVAPTPLNGKNQGTHFYTSGNDLLRIGLFRLLSDHRNIQLVGLGLDEGNRLFHKSGFFFVHAAKVRPFQKSAPPRVAIRLCALHHLKAEIPFLNPSAICFLGIKNLRDIPHALFGQKIEESPIRASLDNWSGEVAAAPQPIRGWHNRTAQVLGKLMRMQEGR